VLKDENLIGVPVSRHHGDSLVKEPNDINYSLMLPTKKCVRHTLASCNI
jgi:hypothetical protein